MFEAASEGAPDATPPRATFFCEICLDEPVEPVVTFCGHLYCWPCLFRWLRSGHAACPTCKAGVSEETIVPLYGRGRERPRAAAGGGGDGGAVPSRPAARRAEVPAPAPAEGWAVPPVQFQFAAGFGFFPSLFGLQFSAFNAGRRTPDAPESAHQRFLERIFLSTGCLVLLFLLFL